MWHLEISEAYLLDKDDDVRAAAAAAVGKLAPKGQEATGAAGDLKRLMTRRWWSRYVEIIEWIHGCLGAL